MPASTSDPISSVLQRTFGGLEQKREGLIRGGNSSSAASSVTTAPSSSVKRPFSLDKQIQASVKNGLVINSNSSTSIMNSSSSIAFDAPTSYKSEMSLHPKVIVLNPKSAAATNGAAVKKKDLNGAASTNGQKPKEEGIPEAKVVLYLPKEIKVGYSQQVRVAGAGMANAGNTCYLNSTLQALFHTPALFNYFQYSCPSQHMSKCSSSLSVNGFLQTCTICAMVHTLRDSLKSSVIRPNRIYEKLKIICKHMVHGRQEDAHEFLRYLIDSLQRSYLNTVPNSKQLDSVSKETTPFNQIFGGFMRQEVTCVRCKHVSTTFQHFMDILVDIQQSNTIEEALAQFFRQRKLGYPGDEASLYKCEKCKVKVQAKWQCFLEKPPAVLCVQLKRFTLLGGKIGKPIQLSRKLDIGSFLKNPVAKNEVTYALRSMITHVGPSPNCGHYTAIGEASNGQFFQFDDASVRPISINQVLRTASYVVFYEMLPSSWSNQLGNHVEKPMPTPKPAMIPRQVNNHPKPAIKPQIINKLGIVSKSIITNIIDTAKKGLVPYDDNDTDDEEEEIMPKTVKKVIEKPLKAISATARNWTVIDASSENQENPSIHSDNSTGSTSNSWIVTPNTGARPASAMSVESDSTKLSSKWTVTTLKKAIEQDSSSDDNIKHSEGSSTNGTSTPSSSGSSGSSTTTASLNSRKRPSIDIDEDDHYDADMDRGRVKKVKTFKSEAAAAVENPFQKQQEWINRSRTEHRSHSQGRSSWDHYGKSRFDRGGDRDRYNNYNNGGNGRRKSFGSFRDSKHNYNRDHKRYHHYGGGSGSHHNHHHHESNHYRDNFHRRSSR